MVRISCISAIIILVSALNVLCGGAPEFQIAKSAYDDELYRIASEQFVKFIKTSPDSPKIHEAYFYLGESEFNLENYPDAVRAYRASAGSPEFAEPSIYKIAKSHLLSGNPEKALESFESLLSAFPEGAFSGAASYWKGESLFRQNRFREAREAYLAVSEINPESAHIETALYSAGICSLKTENYENAESDFERLLSSAPESKTAPGAHYWLGHIRMKAGDPESGAEQFSRVFSEHPENPLAGAALYYAGIIRFRQEAYGEAARLFSEAMEKTGGDLVLKSRLMAGKAFENAGEQGRALECYEGFPGGSPESLRAAYRKGKILLLSGEEEKAFAVLQEIKEFHPGTVEARLGMLWTSARRFTLGEYKKSAESAAILLEAGPDKPLEAAGLFIKGSSYFRLEDFEKAGAAYRSLSEGDFSEYWRENGMFYAALSLFKNKDYPAAAEAFLEFTERFPLSRLKPDALFGAAEAFFAHGAYAEAAKNYREAAGFPGFEDSALIRAGDSLVELGEKEDAAGVYAAVRGSLEARAGVKTARILYLSGDFEEVKKTVYPLLAEDVDYGDYIKYIAAGAELYSGNTERAEELFSSLVEEFPSSRLLPHAFFSLGITWHIREDFEKSALFFDKVKTVFPGSPQAKEALFWLAACMEKTGRNREFAQRLSEYVDTAPEGRHAEQARIMLGRYYYRENEPEKAGTLLEPLLESVGREIRTDAEYWMGHVYAELGEHEKALGMFRRVLENETDDDRVIEILLSKARLFRHQREYENAARVYETILDGYPDAPPANEARYSLGLCLQNLGKHEDAIDVFSMVEPPGEELEAEIQFRTASSYQALGDYERALLEHLKLAYLYPSQTDMAIRGLEAAGKILESLDRPEEAEKLYRKIIELDADGIRGEAAARKLMEITR